MVPFPFPFARHNALQAAVNHSNSLSVPVLRLVTQSYSVVGIDGKNVDVIIGGWKVARVLPTWIKDFVTLPLDKEFGH